MLINKCALFIISCDAYSDLWEPFSILFKRYWPDCPFKIYIGTNNSWFSPPSYHMLSAGPEVDYTTTIIRQLEQLKEPYFLNMNADMFLTQPVNTTLILKCLTFVLNQNANYLRLVPWPKPDLKIEGHPLIGRIKPGAPYKTSLQPSIWNKETFLSLLKEGEKTWGFENTSVGRSKDYQRFYCSWKNLIPYPHDVVVKGKWMRSQARYYKKMNIGCDFTKRPVMTYWETIKHYHITWCSYLRTRIPWKQRRWIYNGIRHCFFN